MSVSELFISFVLGVLTSVIGVIISIRYEKRKEEKERKSRQNKQWESFNEVMYNIRDWARDIESRGCSEIRFISSNQIYNKLACDEIPSEYRKDVFDIAILIDEIKYMILSGTDKKIIKEQAGDLGDLACEYARNKNPELLK